MRARFFQLDAFATRRFTGNPAAIMLLDAWFDEAQLQLVAAENNLSETAFLVPRGADFEIRWFTPTVEVPLCGHATLASAAVVLERLDPGRPSVRFYSKSGPLTVRREGSGFAMDFPARSITPCDAPTALATALRARPVETLWDGGNFLVRLTDAAGVRELAPDIAAIAALPAGGVIVTAAGDSGFDCVSRYFAPAKGLDEDPVTGGAHCGLAPYWAERLGKSEIRAWQASARGGELLCRMLGDRVELVGGCIFYLEGEATW
ncbi:PhzF family phenazine biosynthesis protein [Sphingomonas sp. KR3-1]|uniref:PhzF family phenazine biosynthesis protein n=1 Tax=Sphingomonas sp. KR3-1 TaxID=3156611 RepID=UPI0032B33F29